MKACEMTIEEFTNQLASKAPTPGGGGAAALVGAQSAALGQMVCNLTLGKPKYAEYEEEVLAMREAFAAEQVVMLGLIDKDAEAFAPLSRAYSIPKDDPDRGEVMEAALMQATEPPVAIIESACRIIGKLERLAQVGSKLALSDVASAARLAKSAMDSAAVTAFINTGSMANAQKSVELEEHVERLVSEYGETATQVAEAISDKYRKH